MGMRNKKIKEIERERIPTSETHHFMTLQKVSAKNPSLKTGNSSSSSLSLPLSLSLSLLAVSFPHTSMRVLVLAITVKISAE
jgi:hypothetical protein